MVASATPSRAGGCGVGVGEGVLSQQPWVLVDQPEDGQPSHERCCGLGAGSLRLSWRDTGPLVPLTDRATWAS